MHYFEYSNNELHCEYVPISAIAESQGTPFYLYSLKTLRRHYQVFDQAFAGMPHLVCFAAKANSNIAVLRALINEGGGVDVVSGGELFRALTAGADPKKIVYSGVGKRRDEISYALDAGILMFNVESSQELELINTVAGQKGAKAPIALRVNPDVDPLTHPHISTGLKENKFGIDIGHSIGEYRRARELSNLEIIGVDCHIGSQILNIRPFLEAMDSLKDLIGLLRQEGIDIRYLDIGGGLGIAYDQETPPHPRDYARVVSEKARDTGCTLILEPGRVIVGNAGILVTRVLYTKYGSHKNFIIVDAGMNDLIRPSLYDSYHQILPVLEKEREPVVADIVGPICESSDYFVKDRKVPRFDQGDLVAVMSAGAYGFTMASNYNSRPRAAELLVSGSAVEVIKKRETYQDLIRGESIPERLSRHGTETVQGSGLPVMETGGKK
ncbi:MAG: diaminopimelate decarboxylase [Syntrophales bacterium]|jgi:diaminopimelate decarboxylase|nr:diaminopimelate decarboxylase [Syntrophales bacterium]MCK9528076.1 diaminopimelate decarboxylase [Syntrophales bacterium]MDX9922328.1 diaminopimelate decarboxylase [Syntrophales bacterium]